MISDATRAQLAFHNRPVLGPKAPSAYLNLTRGAVDVDGGPLDVCKPSGAGVPLRMADVVSGLTSPEAQFAFRHRTPLTENCAFGKIEPAAIYSSRGAPCGGRLKWLIVTQ